MFLNFVLSLTKVTNQKQKSTVVCKLGRILCPLFIFYKLYCAKNLLFLMFLVFKWLIQEQFRPNLQYLFKENVKQKKTVQMNFISKPCAACLLRKKVEPTLTKFV